MYKTKQNELLLGYIKSMAGQHLTASQIYDYFQSTQAPIGLATIYRCIDKLSKKGFVRKYLVENSKSACYEYVQQSESGHGFSFHCDSCGKISHFECHELQDTKQHMLKDHGISINSSKTVFYGNCYNCTHKE